MRKPKFYTCAQCKEFFVKQETYERHLTYHSQWTANGERVKAKREALGMTQSQVAREIGVSKGYISLVETGHANCPPKILAWAAGE